jgi:hypothetical protein
MTHVTKELLQIFLPFFILMWFLEGFFLSSFPVMMALASVEFVLKYECWHNYQCARVTSWVCMDQLRPIAGYPGVFYFSIHLLRYARNVDLSNIDWPNMCSRKRVNK